MSIVASLLTQTSSVDHWPARLMTRKPDTGMPRPDTITIWLAPPEPPSEGGLCTIGVTALRVARTEYGRFHSNSPLAVETPTRLSCVIVITCRAPPSSATIGDP